MRAISRRGFTLIELLVVIAIIAVLMASCSPPSRPPERPPDARNASTTSSRSAWPCTTTTMSINSFPMGSSRAPVATNPGENAWWGDWSAHAMLLPYLEQRP